jgi:hypothetical protein
MSFISSVYHKGLHLALGGVGLAAYGVVANAHLVLLLGVALIAWGAYRFRGFRGKAKAGR